MSIQLQIHKYTGLMKRTFSGENVANLCDYAAKSVQIIGFKYQVFFPESAAC